MSIYSSRYGLETVNAELLECINELRFRSVGIIDVAVVSLEGLPIVSLVLEKIEEIKIIAESL